MKVRKRSVFGTAAFVCTLLCAAPSIASEASQGVAIGNTIALQSIQIPPRASRIVRSIDANERVVLRGNTSAAITAGRALGELDADVPLEHLLLALQRAPEQEAALGELIAQQNDQASPNFHHWLSPTQFGQLFGPSDSDIATVTAWLQDNGFVVNEVSAGGTTIDFSGTARQVQKTFSTSLQRFDIDGREHVSNTTDPSIPAAIAPVVRGIVSLNSAFKGANVRRAPAPPLLAAAHHADTGAKFVDYLPSFTYTDANSHLHEDVAPGDFNTIYNVGPAWAAGYRGAGQTIAVIERTKINAADVGTFRTAFGLSTYAGTFSQVVPSGCTDPGVLTTADEGEAALDAEWAGAAAPDATVVSYVCAKTATTDGIDLAVSHVVNLAQPPAIISLSYGQCESKLGSTGNAQYNSWWQQAAAQGETVFVAAGDEGAAECDSNSNTAAPGYAVSGIAVNGLASTPYNVAVGGTDFRDVVDGTVYTYWNSSTSTAPYASARSYVPEMPWNSSCASSVVLAYMNAHGGSYADSVAYCNSTSGKSYIDVSAGGGGPSAKYTRPSWQSSVYGGPTANVRGMPDVSLFAASGFWGHAIVYCMSDTAAGGKPCDYTNAVDHAANAAGGTSFAAPMMAGVQALINQATATRWGNMNTEFYRLAAIQFGTVGAPSSTLSNCNASLGKNIGSACVFNDVTAGDIALPCKAGAPNCFSNVTTTNSNCGASSDCGVLSTTTTALQSAYAATSGWDFATGLGSLNVANLVAAELPEVDYSVSAVSAGNGAITPASQSIASGNAAALTVTPATGYQIASVAGDTCTVTHGSGNAWTTGAIRANCKVTATFSALTYSVSATVAAGNGTVTPASQSIAFGNTAALTVTPASGYQVASVAGDTCTVAHGNGNAWTTGTISANCSVTVKFSAQTYSVSVSVASGDGTVTPASQTVTADGAAAFSIIPASGYHVTSVTGDTCSPMHGSGDAWTSGAIEQNCAITTAFAIDMYTVTSNSNGHGTLSAAQTVASGDAATFVVTPDRSYHVATVTGDTCAVSQTSDTSWSTGAVTSDCTVTATFAVNTLVFTAQPNDVAQGTSMTTLTLEEHGANDAVVDDNGAVDFTIDACGGTFDLGSVTLAHGVATLNSAQSFYTVTSGLTIAAHSDVMSGVSQSFNVSQNADIVFAEGYESCRL